MKWPKIQRDGRLDVKSFREDVETLAAAVRAVGERKGENHRINVSLGRKINVGNYESMDFHVSDSRDLGDDEDRATAFRDLFFDVVDRLNDELDEMGLGHRKIIPRTPRPRGE